MKTLILIILLSLFSLFSYGQKEELIKFLDAYTTAEFEESRECIKNYSFGMGIKYTMLKYNFINGLVFDTDIPGKKAYKAIISANLKKKDGSFGDEKMIVIMFVNQITNQWCVHEFREICDPSEAYREIKTKVETGDFYTDKEYVYRNLVYWCLCAGKISEAKKYMDLALKAANSANNTEFTLNGMDVVIKML